MPTRRNRLIAVSTMSPSKYNRRHFKENQVINSVALKSLLKEPTGYFQRKKRSVNPQSKRQKTIRRQQIARNMGFKRVPRKGSMARSIINQMV